jgi:hypothetical protein
MKIQLRGNCQCCGRLQAVREKGRTAGQSSLHGYEVKGGWFQGVCQGNKYQPMQIERVFTDSLIRSVRADVDRLEADLLKVQAGDLIPTTCQTSNMISYDSITKVHVKHDPKLATWEKVTIPFKDGDKEEQEAAVKSLIWSMKQRIRAGTDFANDMEALVNKVHGTPLIENKIGDGPAPIVSGEQRLLNDKGLVGTVNYTEKGRVYYHYVRAGSDGLLRKHSSWQGSASWRRLPLVEKEEKSNENRI